MLPSLWLLGTLILCGTVQRETAEDRFAARMAQLLDPTVRFELMGFTQAPTPRHGPAKLERPEFPLARADVVPPPVPSPGGVPLRPRISPEPAPLRHLQVAAQVPQTPKLPPGHPVRQASVDVQSPPPLPIIGTYVGDRVSLGDPTIDISVGTTLTRQAPARLSEAPFTPWNLPDPFEHAIAIRLTQPWAETGQPPLFIVPPTRR